MLKFKSGQKFQTVQQYEWSNFKHCLEVLLKDESYKLQEQCVKDEK